MATRPRARRPTAPCAPAPSRRLADAIESAITLALFFLKKNNFFANLLRCRALRRTPHYFEKQSSDAVSADRARHPAKTGESFFENKKGGRRCKFPNKNPRPKNTKRTRKKIGQFSRAFASPLYLSMWSLSLQWGSSDGEKKGKGGSARLKKKEKEDPVQKKSMPKPREHGGPRTLPLPTGRWKKAPNFGQKIERRRRNNMYFYIAQATDLMVAPSLGGPCVVCIFFPKNWPTVEWRRRHARPTGS